MKKLLYAASLLALTVGLFFGFGESRLKADPALELSGGNMYTEASITQGDFAGATGTLSVKAYASGAVTKGDAVVIAVTTPTYPVQVKTTTTAGDPLFFGIALDTAASGASLRVARQGLCRATSAVSCTIGQKFITSGSAGKLTGVAAVSEALFTGLSGTAVAFRALEIRTVTGGTGLILGEVLGK